MNEKKKKPGREEHYTNALKSKVKIQCMYMNLCNKILKSHRKLLHMQ